VSAARALAAGVVIDGPRGSAPAAKPWKEDEDAFRDLLTALGRAGAIGALRDAAAKTGDKAPLGRAAFIGEMVSVAGRTWNFFDA
jgi:hypothetical protein